MLSKEMTVGYHGSDPKFRETILFEGLKAQMVVLMDDGVVVEERGPGVWFADFETAKDFSNGDVWEIDITDYPYEADGHGYSYITHDVPWQKVKLVMEDWEPVSNNWPQEGPI